MYLSNIIKSLNYSYIDFFSLVVFAKAKNKFSFEGQGTIFAFFCPLGLHD